MRYYAYSEVNFSDTVTFEQIVVGFLVFFHLNQEHATDEQTRYYFKDIL